MLFLLRCKNTFFLILTTHANLKFMPFTMTISPVFILAIESSCDDTAAAVLRDDVVLSNDSQ
jgi:hypothetical protein